MIVYRKGGQLRLRRFAAPQPPWFCSTALSPYSARRGSPLSLDYLAQTATAAERVEVTVCDDVRGELERASLRLHPPLLVDCTEMAEQVFRRGEEALAASAGAPALQLRSTRSGVPEKRAAVTAVAAWPPDPEMLRAIAAALRGSRWGVVVPLLFPATTNLEILQTLADLAAEEGASFLAAIAFDADAPAKQAIARSLELAGDDESFLALFHGSLEPLIAATERHVAALAAERGLADFVVPPSWEERSNWNAAALLTLTATRMMAMEDDPELAGSLARSARTVAELDKPLTQIASAASLSIVESLDEAAVDLLSDWLSGAEPAFVARVNAGWRLRRDAGI